MFQRKDLFEKLGGKPEDVAVGVPHPIPTAN
jgi:hypothetical protein